MSSPRFDEESLGPVAEKIAAGDAKAATYILLGVLVTVATGHPVLGGLAAGGAEALANALVLTATKRLKKAEKEWDKEQRRLAAARCLAEGVHSALNARFVELEQLIGGELDDVREQSQEQFVQLVRFFEQNLTPINENQSAILRKLKKLEQQFQPGGEVGSTYYGNLGNLVFSPGDPGERAKEFKPRLTLKNVSNVVVREPNLSYYATTLFCSELNELCPYAPSLEFPAVINATPVRPHLAPGEEWQLDLSRLMSKDLVAGMVAVYQPNAKGSFSWVPPPKTKRMEPRLKGELARKFKITFASADGPNVAGSRLLGNVVWIFCDYMIGDTKITTLYFGGWLLSLGVDASGSIVARSGGVHDFVMRMPFVATESANEYEESQHRIDTTLELAELPGGSVTMWSPFDTWWTAPMHLLQSTFTKHGLKIRAAKG